MTKKQIRRCEIDAVEDFLASGPTEPLRPGDKLEARSWKNDHYYDVWYFVVDNGHIAAAKRRMR